MEVNNTMIVSHEVGQFTSPVDIICPYYGQYEKLSKLLDSIFKHTRSNPYRVCVVDDGSPNETFSRIMKENATKHAQQKKIRNVFQSIRLPEQKGFAAAMKAGYEATEAPYVCFLNSDCLIEDANWLRAMGECLVSLKSKNVRMVSPVTNNIVGGSEKQYGERLLRNKNPDPLILEAGEHLSLYCVMCHRELFAHCGGFFKEYPYGFFEDEEFAARMAKCGFKQAVCRRSWVYHEGAATIKSIWRRNPVVRDIMEKDNRERCIEDMRKLK
jgi:GT2 family glycosyltransferase